MKVKYIEWFDSKFHNAWSWTKEFSPATCRSVGFEIENCKDSVTLALCLGDEDDHAQTVTISKPCIKRTITLKGVPNAS